MPVAPTTPSRTLTDLLFEKEEVGLCLVAPDGTVLRANAKWLRSTGFTEEQVVGQSMVELFPDTRETVLEMHARARAGLRVDVPRHVQVVNGRETRWEGTLDPVAMEGGTGLLITTRDVTHDVRRDRVGTEPDAPALDDLYTALFEHSPECVIITRTDGTVVRANPAACRVYGAPESEVCGRGRAAYVVRDAALEAFLSERERTGAAHGRITARRNDGTVFPVEASSSLIMVEGSEQYACVIFHDVTDEQRKQDALRHASELLDLGDAFCELDSEYRLVRVNARQEQLTKTPREQSVGRTHWELWPESARPDSPWWREYHRCMEERVPVAFENYYAPLDLWSSVTAYPTSSGGIAIFFRDVRKRKQAEEELRRSEAALDAFFANSPGLLVLADEEFRYVKTDATTPTYFGLTRESIVGKRVAELAPALIEELGPVLRRVIDRGEPALNQEAQIAWRGRAAELAYWRSSCFPVQLPGGKRGVGLMGVEITDLKNAERALRESEDLYRSLFTLAPSGVVLNDAEGRILAFNDQTHEQLGYTREEFARLHLADVDAEEQPVDVRNHITEITARGGAEYEVRHRTKSGEIRNVLVRTRPVRIGGELRFVNVWQDITDRKRAESALRDSDQRKSEFLGVLSHELRNPLAPIRNSIYLLDRAPAGSEQARRAREVIARQTEHLTRLIDDLLDVTRISRGKIVLHEARLDLRDLARKTASDFHSLFVQAKVELAVEDGHTPIWIEADPVRVAQVIGNVLQNAVKFTPSGGSVKLALTARDGSAWLTVRDDGIGIEPAMLARVFEPFAQAEQSLARTKGGLGLGLALVKGLIELHGGSVEARSNGVGHGTEIAIRLPLAAAAAASDGEAGARAPSRRRSVLVVEDNLDAAQSLADILELGGHRVTVVRDGRSGIEAARKLRPEVILCDIGLPDLDGYEVARALRRDEALRGTRLVAVTGYAQPEDRQRAQDAGFDGHLAKPLNPDELERALE
ncbi:MULTISPECIES: PAS domain S-box protein [Anaeromyxobacter]|uniref:PAS domain S-box protein n=1 Tax=Anaeromyxobacter TaxID=161492 RepID=UPI001F577672|nr:MULTISPECIES: PAS domain S-box protein [unclassified Anaeromyxobacter]